MYMLRVVTLISGDNLSGVAEQLATQFFSDKLFPEVECAILHRRLGVFSTLSV